MSFTFTPLALPGVVLIRPSRRGDARGFFSETWRRSAFAEAGIDVAFVQDNLSRSGPGVLRGLHFQLAPRSQGKLVRVVRGRVFDVAVDVRPESPTFRRWVGVELTEDGGETLWIPPGFAHGYAVLGGGADLFYKVTEEFDAALDRGIRWNDPAIGVEWPIPEPVLSERDRSAPFLADAPDLPGLDGQGEVSATAT